MRVYKGHLSTISVCKIKKYIMKKLLLVLLVLVPFFAKTQCDNGTNYYPSTIGIPPVDSWSYATTCNWAGEVMRMQIESGDTYQFSTCDGYGGVLASYDTQITLRDASGNLLAYNDDYSGCAGFTSYINWTATYTGVLYVHLNEYPCSSNFTCTQIMVYRTEPIALPITLYYFNAFHIDNIDNTIQIEWITHSEQNNDYFTVLKSYDGYEWFELCKVPGTGNSNMELSYSVRDTSPRSGVQYYKLRQTDYDGKWEEFEAVSVTIKTERKEIVKSYNQMGQEVSIDEKGLIFLIWDNGDTTKKFNP